MKNEKSKRKKLTSLFAVMLAFVMCMLTACGATDVVNYYDLKVKEQTSDFYVNDFAGVLNHQQKAQLMESAVNMDKEYSGIQVVITTVETLDSAVVGYKKSTTNSEDGSKSIEEIDTSSKSVQDKHFSIEEVAYSMYEQYGIGKNDMGILILLSIGDREVRIETGYQMQNFITDAVSGQLLDEYAIPYFAEDKFAEGLVSLQTAVISEIEERVDKEWQSTIVVTPSEKEEITLENEDIIAENQEQITATHTKDEENAGKGLIAGFVGAVSSVFLAVGAMIYNIFTGKSKRKKLEEKREADLAQQEQNFHIQITKLQGIHEREIRVINAKHNQELQEKNSKILSFTNNLNVAEREINSLSTSLKTVEDKYLRIQRLHPEIDFEGEIQEMIEGEFKAEAEEIQRKLEPTYHTSADKDNVSVFAEALSTFNAIPSEVLKYVTLERKALEDLYNASVTMKQEHERIEQEKKDKATAENAYAKINAIYSENQRGNYETFTALNGAMGIFFALTVAQKAFFPDDDLILKLKNVHSSAKKDYDDYQAAKKAEENIQRIMRRCSYPDEDDRDELESAMNIYRTLTAKQQKYFSDEILRKLKRMIEDAEEDYEENERRRRERRNSSYGSSSHSSFHSSSSGGFSGHGGRPSGGGASRRF